MAILSIFFARAIMKYVYAHSKIYILIMLRLIRIIMMIIGYLEKNRVCHMSMEKELLKIFLSFSLLRTYTYILKYKFFIAIET